MYLLLSSMLFATLATDVEIDGLKSKAPEGWKEEKPANTMQFKVFSLPKAAGDEDKTSLVIFYFPNGVGGEEANMTRWKGMFIPPEGKKLEDIAKISKMEVGKNSVSILDISGTYKQSTPGNPNAPTVEKKDHRMFGVFWSTKNGDYTMRLVGPTKSVTAAEKGFMEWLKNFK